MSLISEVASLFIESKEAETVANLIIASGLTIGIIRTTFLALRVSKSIYKRLQS